jgi:hypothetical protein
MQGYLWEAAIQFKAFVLFVEHRYYGSSLPFGNDSYKVGESRLYRSTFRGLISGVGVGDSVVTRNAAKFVFIHCANTS